MESVLEHGEQKLNLRADQPAFFSGLPRLTELVTVLFDRAVPTDPADLVVFSLGRRVASDFDDALLLCLHRRADNALALLRAMFERTITARYIHNHPSEAMRFAEFDYVQRAKLAREIEQRLGLTPEDALKMKELIANADAVRENYRVTDCEKCGTTRINYTWHKLDVVSMTANTEKNTSNLTDEEREEAKRTKKRLSATVVFGYFNPLGQTHATFRSAYSAFGEVDGSIAVVLPAKEDVTRILETAHQIVLEALLVQVQRFKLAGSEEAFTRAVTHFRKSWQHTFDTEGQ